MWEQSYIFNLEGKEELMHCNVWNEATLGDDQSGNKRREGTEARERDRRATTTTTRRLPVAHSTLRSQLPDLLLRCAASVVWISPWMLWT